MSIFIDSIRNKIINFRDDPEFHTKAKVSGRNQDFIYISIHGEDIKYHSTEMLNRSREISDNFDELNKLLKNTKYILHSQSTCYDVMDDGYFELFMEFPKRCYRCDNKPDNNLTLCEDCHRYCCINCASLVCKTCNSYYNCYPCSFAKKVKTGNWKQKCRKH